MGLAGDHAASAAQPPKRVQENRIMNVIDFRFRPNTPEIINGIKNSTMFKAACKAIGFDARKPQPLDEIVADLNNLGVELGVITGRDCETTYGLTTFQPAPILSKPIARVAFPSLYILLYPGIFRLLFLQVYLSFNTQTLQSSTFTFIKKYSPNNHSFPRRAA